MKKHEIKAGCIYVAKVSGKLTTVRVDAIRDDGVHIRIGGRSTLSGTRYDVTNLATGRRTTFRSAAKFRQAGRYPTAAEFNDAHAACMTEPLTDTLHPDGF